MYLWGHRERKREGDYYREDHAFLRHVDLLRLVNLRGHGEEDAVGQDCQHHNVVEQLICAQIDADAAKLCG